MSNSATLKPSLEELTPLLNLDEILSEKDRRQSKRTAYTIPEFRGAALELQTSTDNELVCAGPADTGKTLAVSWKVDESLRQHPGAQAVLVRKIQATIYGTVLQRLLAIIERRAAHDVKVTAYGGQKPEWIDYSNGSRLWIAGMDNPGKALSSDRDLIFVNQAEELSLNDWQTLTTRTTGRSGRIPFPQTIGDANPGPPQHWIINRPSLKVLHSRHVDNPALYHADGTPTPQAEARLKNLQNLTGVLYERLYLGRWVAAEGVVFDFDPAIHRLTHAELVVRGILDASGALGPMVRFTVAGLDWGLTAPGVLQVWAVDGDGRAYLVREWYQTGKLIDWWTARAIEVKASYSPRAFVCDPSEPAYIEQLSRAGCNAVPGDNEREPGIQSVQMRLRPATDGRPRLYVSEDALAERDPGLVAIHHPLTLEQEFAVLVWKQNAAGVIKEGETTGPDHGADTARYVMRWIDSTLRLGSATVHTGPHKAADAPSFRRLPSAAFGGRKATFRGK